MKCVEVGIFFCNGEKAHLRKCIQNSMENKNTDVRVSSAKNSETFF